MLPLSALFLFFLHNNISHVRKQEREVRSVIASTPGVDAARGEAYLKVLRRHCISQNRAMVIAAFFALFIYFLIEIVFDTFGIRNERGTLELRRLIGGEEWPFPPSLAEVVADD